LFGLINDESNKFDTSFANTLQNHLFEFPAGDGTFIVVDLVSANINRGRDHGLPSYNSYREMCGFTRAQKFDDLVDIMPRENIEKLAQLYEYVKNYFPVGFNLINYS
jgi:peroxidase